MAVNRSSGRCWIPASALALATLLGSCIASHDEHPLDILRQPTGLAISPGGKMLFVSNGDWDRRYETGTLVALDLSRLDAGIEQPLPPGTHVSGGRPCRRTADLRRVECDPRLLINAQSTVRIGSGAGNIAIDRPGGDHGPLRLLVPSRHAADLTWIDVRGADEGELELECGAGATRHCDSDHILTNLHRDPARILVDSQGYRYAYLPHLSEGQMSLIDLDGESGPELVRVFEEFFAEDQLFDSGLRGGFSVAQRPCDPERRMPADSRECTRPYLHASQRYYPAIRPFVVDPGNAIVRPRSSYCLQGRSDTGACAHGSYEDAVHARPIVADLEFVDPQIGDTLLAVSTTPPSLTVVDTSVDEHGALINERLSSIPICNNPNLLEIHRPDDGTWLAFVACYAVAEVVAVSLAHFSIVATLHLGAGANEMLIDSEREHLYVANTVEDTISIVELDSLSPRYLQEIAVLGLNTRREET